MNEARTTYAFVDWQNINPGVQNLGWRLDWRRFRTYLRDKYGVRTAFLFLGRVPGQHRLREFLRTAGYVLVSRPVVRSEGGRLKGNADTDLVLKAMREWESYDQAVVVTSDGDFHCLVDHLREHKKLAAVLTPNWFVCSALLKEAAKDRLHFLETDRSVLERASSRLYSSGECTH